MTDKFCPNGHGRFADGLFCPKCGSKLKTNRISQENKAPHKVGGAQTCPSCAFPLNHGHQKYCPGCGHELIWTCR